MNERDANKIRMVASVFKIGAISVTPKRPGRPRGSTNKRKRQDVRAGPEPVTNLDNELPEDSVSLKRPRSLLDTSNEVDVVQSLETPAESSTSAPSSFDLDGTGLGTFNHVQPCGNRSDDRQISTDKCVQMDPFLGHKLT